MDSWKDFVATTQKLLATGEYSQEDLRAGKHTADFQKIQDGYKKFSKVIGTDAEALAVLKRAERAHSILEKTRNPNGSYNISDRRRYIPEDSKVAFSAITPENLAQVDTQNAPKTAVINNRLDYLSRPEADIYATLAHEFAHTSKPDELTADLPIYKIVEKLTKPDFARRVYRQTAGQVNGVNSNSLLNSEEARATLVQMLGSAPKGTKLLDLISEPLQAAIKKDPSVASLKRTPDNKLRKRGEVQSDVPVEVLMKSIEADMFPKERWIDERPPSIKETIDDFVSKLFQIKDRK